MIQFSLWIGLLLVALGIGGYIATDMVSPTALIPAVFGTVIIMLSVVGRAERRRRTAMHIAMGVALIGLLGTLVGFIDTVTTLLATRTDPTAAELAKAAMAFLLIIYLAAGIRSFIVARRP